jgi:hypothetical protein
VSKRRKKYTGNLHDQPYELEDGVFDRHKTDPDYDNRDLARTSDYGVDRKALPARDEPDPLTQLDLGNRQEPAAVRGSQWHSGGAFPERYQRRAVGPRHHARWVGHPEPRRHRPYLGRHPIIPYGTTQFHS